MFKMLCNLFLYEFLVLDNYRFILYLFYRKLLLFGRKPILQC